MRKTLITYAAAASALVVAAPAAAQYYGPAYGVPAYGAPAHGAPYGNAYGNRFGGRNWARELQQIRIQADNLSRAGRLTRSEARDLYRDLRSAERQAYRSGRYGITRREARSLNDKIARVRFELRRYSDRDGWRYGYRGY